MSVYQQYFSFIVEIVFICEGNRTGIPRENLPQVTDKFYYEVVSGRQHLASNEDRTLTSVMIGSDCIYRC